MYYATVYHGAPYRDNERGHVDKKFTSTFTLRRHLDRMSGTTYGLDHHVEVVDADEQFVRELSPHEDMLAYDTDYARIHGDVRLAPAKG